VSANEVAQYVNEKNINKRDAGTGDTPLLAAARYNNLPVLKFLLQKGAQPNDLYSEPEYLKSYPALWFAVRWNNAEMVQALLDAGADARLGEKSGFGPIIHNFSESGGSNEALEQLLKADKTLANWKIWTGTPLHRAANSGHVDTIRLLLRYGADKTLTDREGHTAWFWAQPDTKKAVPELEPYL
jgi:ankyrin repeat protein